MWNPETSSKRYYQLHTSCTLWETTGGYLFWSFQRCLLSSAGQCVPEWSGCSHHQVTVISRVVTFLYPINKFFTVNPAYFIRKYLTWHAYGWLPSNRLFCHWLSMNTPQHWVAKCPSCMESSAHPHSCSLTTAHVDFKIHTSLLNISHITSYCSLHFYLSFKAPQHISPAHSSLKHIKIDDRLQQRLLRETQLCQSVSVTQAVIMTGANEVVKLIFLGRQSILKMWLLLTYHYFDICLTIVG